jgi:hypothetical protein
MKKNLKKIFATAFAASLAFVSVIGSKPVTVKADSDYTAFLMYCDENWGNGNWDSTYASTTVSSEGGSYTVTLNATDVGADGATAITGAQVFCVDITGAQEGLSADGKTFALTDISVELDGQAIDVDASKVVTGDIEENGNYRIEIYNPGGGGATGTDSPIDASALTFTNTIAVNFSLDVVDAAASDDTDGTSAEVSTEQTAFLMFCDENWGNGNWDSTFASTTVSGDGTYTVTLNATDVGADGATAIVGSQVFCVDVYGLSASVTDASAISLDDISVELDGQAIDVDASKVVTGDIEENGNYRIEIYNPGGGGDTGTNAPIDPAALTFTNTISVTFTLSGITYGASEASDADTTSDSAPVASVDLDGTYHAYLGLQTPAYSFRNAYDDATYGYGTDYFNQITGWVNNEAVTMDGTFTDAEIAGNGTYTVSVSGMNFDASEFDSQDYMNLIFLSTDIPNSGEITISDIVLNVDGQTPSISPILSPDSVDYVNMLIQNIWNDDVATIGYYSVPPTEMSITFTVSGFNYDNPDATGATEEVAEETVDTGAADTGATTDTAPAETESEQATEAATESSSGVSTGVVVVIVIVVIVVVAVAVGAGVSASKKKKENQ